MVPLKKTLVKGVGLPLVFANWLMAGWAVAWVSSANVQFHAQTSNVFLALPSIPRLHDFPGHTSSPPGIC